MRLALTLLLVLLAAAAAPAANSVLHLAPDFTFPAAGVKARSLRSLRGQPVILLLADSPQTKLFRKQLDLLRRGYAQFASRQAIFAAALRQGDGPIASNVPFLVANNGPGVAAAYGLNGKFAVAIIGKDGNIDYWADKVVPVARIFDIVENAYPVQSEQRHEIQR